MRSSKMGPKMPRRHKPLCVNVMNEVTQSPLGLLLQVSLVLHSLMLYYSITALRYLNF